jgi:hypothetical protein
MRPALIAAGTMLLAALGLALFVLWPRPLHFGPPPIAQVTETTEAGVRIFLPQRVLVGKLGEYRDGLFAYLMFDHFRSLPELRGMEVLLTSREERDTTTYPVLVRLPDDLIGGTTLLETLRAERWTTDVLYQWMTYRQFWDASERSATFAEAYNDPAPGSFQRIARDDLKACLPWFIRFKSLTDYRIEHGTDPTLQPLTQQQAEQMTEDMIAVSRFYDVPLTLFLGIGAMENNYMNAPGDLTHTVWKRRPEPGDVVLKRLRRRVLVKDDAVGVWQITRKELRRAHQLYLKDKRDYSQLPQRLVPPKELDVDNVAPETLTTYAGLLLRQLLDHFQGDEIQAAGAYNGTLEHPNLRYAAGVATVAEYAERVVGHATEIEPLPVPSDAAPAPVSLQSSMLESISAVTETEPDFAMQVN